MGICKDQIEHPRWMHDEEKPWKNYFKSSKWLKKQMNRFMRRKPIEEDEIGGKTNRKPTKGWEY